MGGYGLVLPTTYAHGDIAMWKLGKHVLQFPLTMVASIATAS